MWQIESEGILPSRGIFGRQGYQSCRESGLAIMCRLPIEQGLEGDVRGSKVAGAALCYFGK